MVFCFLLSFVSFLPFVQFVTCFYFLTFNLSYLPLVLSPVFIPSLQINPISDNIGVVYSGMGPDSRVLLRKGRKISMNYNLYYQVQRASTFTTKSQQPLFRFLVTSVCFLSVTQICPLNLIFFFSHLPIFFSGCCPSARVCSPSCRCDARLHSIWVCGGWGCLYYLGIMGYLLIVFLIYYLLCHRGVRPFGCSLLLAGIDERGPQVSLPASFLFLSPFLDSLSSSLFHSLLFFPFFPFFFPFKSFTKLTPLGLTGRGRLLLLGKTMPMLRQIWRRGLTFRIFTFINLSLFCFLFLYFSVPFRLLFLLFLSSLFFFLLFACHDFS